MAGGRGAAAQAGARAFPGTLVESCNLAAPVADVAVDGQGLLQLSARARAITRQPPHGAQVAEGAGVAGPVASHWPLFAPIKEPTLQTGVRTLACAART
jgi:hypothetical protein